jgi:hypothetical protein
MMNNECARDYGALVRHSGFLIHSGFVIPASSFFVDSRNNLSSVVVDFRRSISFAFERLMSDSISSG